jgi:hypothetical protein
MGWLLAKKSRASGLLIAVRFIWQGFWWPSDIILCHGLVKYSGHALLIKKALWHD